MSEEIVRRGRGKKKSIFKGKVMEITVCFWPKMKPGSTSPGRPPNRRMIWAAKYISTSNQGAIGFFIAP